MRMLARRLAFLLALACAAASAQDRLVKGETRAGVTVSLLVAARLPRRPAVVHRRRGQHRHARRRTAAQFSWCATARFSQLRANVAVISRPSDVADMDDRFPQPAAPRGTWRRFSPTCTDVRRCRHGSSAPRWTQISPVAAVAAAPTARRSPASMLTSSITSFRMQVPCPGRDLRSSRVPALVMHHRRDACWACAPHGPPSPARPRQRAGEGIAHGRQRIRPRAVDPVASHAGTGAAPAWTATRPCASSLGWIRDPLVPQERRDHIRSSRPAARDQLPYRWFGSTRPWGRATGASAPCGRSAIGMLEGIMPPKIPGSAITCAGATLQVRTHDIATGGRQLPRPAGFTKTSVPAGWGRCQCA